MNDNALVSYRAPARNHTLPYYRTVAYYNSLTHHRTAVVMAMGGSGTGTYTHRYLCIGLADAKGSYDCNGRCADDAFNVHDSVYLSER